MASHENVDRVDDWQVKCTKVKKRMVHLFTSREWSDCTFQFDSAPGQSISAGPNTSQNSAFVGAHKLILAMSSPVFAAQFYGSLASQDPILITDIEPSTFLIMLRYIYTDNIEVYNVKTALEVYYVAKKYLLHYLEDQCINIIVDELNPHNVCDVYEFACFHDEKELKEKCNKIFTKKTRDVLKSRNFLRAKVDTVKHILSMSPLNVSSELDLFNALLLYADNEVNNKHLVEDMASTLCTLFTKYSTKVLRLLTLEKEVSKVEESTEKTITISSETSSENESETEDRPSVSSVIVPKNTTTEKPLDKVDMVREILRPCVQQIRFLTLTPCQFAESTRLRLLLQNEEIMAIAMNIASKNTAVEMPEGFSKSLLPRYQHQTRPTAMLRFTVNNIEHVKKFTSDVVCSRNIPWSVSVLYQEKRKSSEARLAYLRVLINCLVETNATWSCPTTYTIRTIHSVVNNQDFALTLQKHAFTFTNEKTSAAHLYQWNAHASSSAKLQASSSSSITFEVNITPHESFRLPSPSNKKPRKRD